MPYKYRQMKYHDIVPNWEIELWRKKKNSFWHFATRLFQLWVHALVLGSPVGTQCVKSDKSIKGLNILILMNVFELIWIVSMSKTSFNRKEIKRIKGNFIEDSNTRFFSTFLAQIISKAHLKKLVHDSLETVNTHASLLTCRRFKAVTFRQIPAFSSHTTN